MHVDDFQVVSPHQSRIDKLMKALHDKYKLKTVSTNMFLGIEISHPYPEMIRFSQGHYARTLLNRHNLSDCKKAGSPIERMMEGNKEKCMSHEMTEYNSLIGGLQYLSNNTRPDISFAVNHLARFLTNPSQEHMQAARQVLRYIANNPDQGIEFTRHDQQAILEAYTDADFAADPSTSRSTSGMLIRLASGPICWKSHLQQEVVLSTTEAEYLAATETCRQLQWVKSLIQELGLSDHVEGATRTNLHVDNQAAISLIKNHDNHRRSKHIALRNFFCREQHENGKITVSYVPSNLQLADALTKVKSPVAIH